MPTLTLNDTLIETLRESFVQDAGDALWYPIERGAAGSLVRVTVARDGASYMIERRRDARSPWLPVVTAHTAEFDPAAFRSWRANWRLIA